MAYQLGLPTLESLLGAVSRTTLLTAGMDAYLEESVKIPVRLKLVIAAKRLPLPRDAWEMQKYYEIRTKSLSSNQPFSDELAQELLMEIKAMIERREFQECNALD